MKFLIIIAIIFSFSFTSAVEQISFATDVKPIFLRSCTGCHNGSNPLPVVSLYDVAFSLKNEIKTRVSDDKTMPKYSTHITESERDLVGRWVTNGAKK